MHFFGYRSCGTNADCADSTIKSSQVPQGDISPLAGEPEDGARSRLVFLEAQDEYRVVWDAERLPHSFELFVDGSDKKGVIEISRKQNGSLSVAARALPPERSPREGGKRVDDRATSVWAVRARENARWEPSPSRNEVRIDLSRDSGKTWDPLFNEAPTGGPETWSITGPMGQNCRVRIRTMGT